MRPSLSAQPYIERSLQFISALHGPAVRVEFSRILIARPLQRLDAVAVIAPLDARRYGLECRADVSGLGHDERDDLAGTRGLSPSRT